MAKTVTCSSCGWSWNKSDSSKKDVFVCHKCGKDNKYIPKAQNGIEGTMGGLTDKGFNYNGAWGGTMQFGGVLPGAMGNMYARHGAPSEGKYAKKTMSSAQKGKKLPIIQTSDPADPRLHSYLDSLNLNKAYLAQQKFNPSKNVKEYYTQEIGKNVSAEILKNVINEQETYKKGYKFLKDSKKREVFNPKSNNDYFKSEKELTDYSPQDAALINAYKSLTFSSPTETGLWTTPDLYNKVIAPTDVYFGGKEHVAYNPVYKAPMQQVEYTGNPKDYMQYRSVPTIYGTKHKFNPKSKLTPKSNKPSAVQPSKPSIVQSKKETPVVTPPVVTSIVQPQQPIPVPKVEEIKTQYSYTYPTFDKDVQKTMYFPDEKSLKEFTNKQKYTSRQFGKDWGTATGYYTPEFQNGGEMSFYQNGLDWTPRNISKNGGWLDKYNDDEIPKAQLGLLTSESTALPRNLDPRMIAAIEEDMKRTNQRVIKNTKPFLEEVEYKNLPEIIVKGNNKKKKAVLDNTNKSNAFPKNLDSRIKTFSDNTRVQNYIPQLSEEAFNTKLVTDIQEIAAAFDKEKKLKGIKNAAIRTADVTTDLMQLGNFVPHLIPQLIGKIGNITGSSIDAYQAAEALMDKDYQTAAINTASAILPSLISNRNILGGLYRRSAKYNFGNRSFYLPVDRTYGKMTKNQLSANRALLSTLGAETIYDVKKQGGEIKKDDNGYWNPENWGKPVEIGSNEITMQGVYEPLLGVSDTGDTQMMYPGEDYTFNGESVTEYPIAQNGKKVKTLPTLYVDNLNNVRLKAYNDSLRLYKQGVEDEQFFREHGFKNKITHTFPFSKVTSFSGNANPSKGKIKPTSAVSQVTDPSHPNYYRAEWFNYKKPVRKVEFRKPEPKTEPSVKKVEQPKPIESKQNVYEGNPVYSPGAGSGMPSALIGFINKSGDTTFIKPEDYERFAVPSYGKAYIESKTVKKQKNGGWLDKYN
jgi:hypothetical protein